MKGNTVHPSSFSGLLTAVWLALLMAMAGCGKAPNDLLQAATQARRDAEAAEGRLDVKAAESAAKRARHALDRLEKLANSQGAAAPEAQRVLGEARLASFAAQEHFEVARQTVGHRDLLAGWKVKAYRAARGPVIQGLCAAATFGAEKAAQQGANALTVGGWNVAEDARKIAALTAHFDSASDSLADWPAVAEQYRRWGTNPPVEASTFLGIALVLVGQTDFALAELEAVNSTNLASPNLRMLHHGFLAMVLAAKGWDRLAIREVQRVAEIAPDSDFQLTPAEAGTLIHLCLAVAAGDKRDWVRVDREIAECVKLSPNSPVVVYLTGERLASNGEWEKAAESLEAQAQSAEDQWFAQRLAQRARELRDGRGNGKQMVLDPKFITEVAFHLAISKARNGEAGRRLQSLYEEAGTVGKQMLEKLHL